MAKIRVEKGEFAVNDTVLLNLDESKTTLQFKQAGNDIVMHLTLLLKNEGNIYIGQTEVEADSLGVFKFDESNSFLQGGLEKLSIRFDPPASTSTSKSRVRLQTSAREFDMKTTGEKKESGIPFRARADKNQTSPA